MRRPLVLIVEDAQSVRRLVRLTLEDHPCDLREAATGQEALLELAANRPDLVILDRGLPDMDGLEVLSRMRTHPELQSVPVILLTGRATAVDVVSGLASGAFDFVAKPFEPAELAARVTVALRVMALTDELRQRNADLSSFASRAAHDLKSPLAAIRGLADTLALRWDRLTDDRRQELLRMISSSADRAAAMVQDLLSLARYDAKDEDHDQATVDPQWVLREVLAGAPLAGGDDVRVSGSFAAVRIPPAELAAVLTNLVDNAAHYGRDADGRLTLRVEAAISDGHMQLTISDRGPGVADEEVTRVFEAFYRPSASLQRNPSSTGVGLAIVRRAVERWNGSVTLRRADPHGAAFVLELPLAAIDDARLADGPVALSVVATEAEAAR